MSVGESGTCVHLSRLVGAAEAVCLANDAPSLEGTRWLVGTRKCKCCLKLFVLIRANRRHQRYCSARRCRAASKAASQAR